MIKILVDSATDINLEEANSLSIHLISMTITFGDEEYLDGINLNSRQFFNKLIESDAFPKTSQINQNSFEEKFDELTADGSEVLCITISSKLSGTFHSAACAAAKYNGKVAVIDSLQCSIGERILCQYAMYLVKKGTMTLAEIANELNGKKAKIQVLALLDTLQYLKKGGRISPVVAFAGELLSIKPVVSLQNGEVQLVGKAMGSKKGNNLLSQLVEKCGGIDFSMPFALAYFDATDIVLKKYFTDSRHLWESHVREEDIPYYMIGSTIGTHVGPGTIAVSFFAK